MKAKCSHDMQIKCIKETYYDQNMPFSMTKFVKLPSARNGASEHSIVCFHVSDKGTCTNKENLVFFLSTKCLTLLLLKQVSDNKVNHLSSSALQSSVQKELWLLILLGGGSYLLLQGVPEKNLSLMTVVVLQYINAPSATPLPFSHLQLIYIEYK